MAFFTRKSLILAFFFSSCALAETATVVRVKDGDTFVLNTGIVIRAAVVDAPEYSARIPAKTQPFGEFCKTAAEQLLLNQEINYTVVGNSYGRQVARISIGGVVDFGSELLEAGCAWLDLRNTKGMRDLVLIYKQNLKNAQANKIGLWQDELPTEPRLWRHK
jgi:endonuclease YncB( thermonuclease family)